MHCGRAATPSPPRPPPSSDSTRRGRFDVRGLAGAFHVPRTVPLHFPRLADVLDRTGRTGPEPAPARPHAADLSAIVVVSPHWQTQGVRVGATAMPETIHDFGGFPAPLYELQYTPPGAPALAAQIVRMLVDAGFLAPIAARRGLDHGAWVSLARKSDVSGTRASVRGSPGCRLLNKTNNT